MSIASERYMSKPVVVSVVGTFRGGKSTLINALLGDEIVPSSLVATTATVSVFDFSSTYGATIHFRDAGSLKEATQRIRAAIHDCGGDPAMLLSRLAPPGARLDAELEVALGCYGVLTAAGHVDEDRLEAVFIEPWRARRFFPTPPYSTAFGTDKVIEAASVEALRKELAQYTAFAGAAASFSFDASALSYAVESVVIRGPFALLRSNQVDEVPSLRLADTPGLGDPRASPAAIVRAHLDTGDGIVLNLTHGVWSGDDKEVIRELFVRDRLPDELIVAIGMADQLNVSDLAKVKNRLHSDLESVLRELGASPSEAVRLARVPIIPICALAAVVRHRRAALSSAASAEGEGGEWLLGVRYPGPSEDGTAELSAAIHRAAVAAVPRRSRDIERRRREEARRREAERQRLLEEERQREAAAAARLEEQARIRREQAQRAEEERRRVEAARVAEEARQREAERLRLLAEREAARLRARSPCYSCFLPQYGASNRFRDFVYHLTDSHGLSMSEVESICGVGESTIRNYMSRGLSDSVRDNLKYWMGR